VTKSESISVGLEHWSRYFDPDLPSAAFARPGDKVVVQTHCCSKGAVTRSISSTPDGFYSELAYTPGMPVTGPIYIHGAQVGDVLRVEVLDIQIADQGWTMALKGRGAIGHRIDTGESRVLPIEDGEVVFLDRARLPARPMIGSIGTTPAGGPWLAGNPGPHGGNMDCKLLGAGTAIFLPVLVPGAQLALGDLHAVQGDGETGCAGAEIAGEVILRVRLLRGIELPLPLLETPDLLATIHTARDLREAATGATEQMAGFLAHRSGLSLAEAAMLLSLAGDLSICQIVNPTMTCRMEVPKPLLYQLGIDLAALWQLWEVQAGRAGQ
jgi:amidase